MVREVRWFHFRLASTGIAPHHGIGLGQARYCVACSHPTALTEANGIREPSTAKLAVLAPRQTETCSIRAPGSEKLCLHVVITCALTT